jgi:ribosomal protein L40E
MAETAGAEAAKRRIFDRVWVCMSCNAKIRADLVKVKAGKIKCRKCGRKNLRPKKKGVKK